MVTADGGNEQMNTEQSLSYLVDDMVGWQVGLTCVEISGGKKKKHSKANKEHSKSLTEGLFFFFNDVILLIFC